MKRVLVPRFSGAVFLTAALVSVFSSCSTFDQSGLPGSAASMAHNQLMYVSREKQTFGYYRVRALTASYRDLDFFVRERGIPQFLAETTNEGQHYYILYYLDDRTAYASRPRPGSGNSLEFSGPYPITPREVETLNQLQKRNPDNASAEWGGARKESQKSEVDDLRPGR